MKSTKIRESSFLVCQPQCVWVLWEWEEEIPALRTGYGSALTSHSGWWWVLKWCLLGAFCFKKDFLKLYVLGKGYGLCAGNGSGSGIWQHRNEKQQEIKEKLPNPGWDWVALTVGWFQSRWIGIKLLNVVVVLFFWIKWSFPTKAWIPGR